MGFDILACLLRGFLSEHPLVSPRGGTKAPTFTAQGSVKNEGKRRRTKGFHIAAGGSTEGKAVVRSHTQ